MMFEVAHLFDLMGASRDDLAWEIAQLMGFPPYLNEWNPDVWVTDYVDWNGNVL